MIGVAIPGAAGRMGRMLVEQISLAADLELGLLPAGVAMGGPLDIPKREIVGGAAGADLKVHTWDALLPGLKQAIQADFTSAWFMYGILIVLVAFSVLNTQLMSVLERTKEFGIVMSLGVTPGRLGRLVLLETALMGTLGLVLGALLGGALVAWLGHHGFSYPGMEEMAGKFNLPSRIYPPVTLIGLFFGPAIILVSSVIASLYPAIRLRWLEPVAAMRAA